jgi:predicted SAM-dependent methyltransferase
MSGPVRQAWARLRFEILLAAVHVRTLLLRGGRVRALAARGGLRLHVGCGDNLKSGWVNVDLHPAADLRLDVRRRWPFPDGCASEVYAEHLFEHLAWPGEGRRFLAEAYRVLRSGGVLRLSVPDLERHVRAYAEGDEEFGRAFAPFLPPWAATRADALNHHFRQDGEHQYSYDAETLAARLGAAGFADPAVVASFPECEQPSRDFESLVMTARRP